MSFESDLYGNVYKSQKTKNAAAKRKKTNENKEQMRQNAYNQAFERDAQTYAKKNNISGYSSADLGEAARAYYGGKKEHQKFLDWSNKESASRNKAELKSHASFAANEDNKSLIDEYNAARKKMNLQPDNMVTKKKYDQMFGYDTKKGVDNGMINRYEQYLTSRDLKVNHNEKKSEKASSFDKKIDKGIKGLAGFVEKVKNSKIVQGTEDLAKKIDDNKIGHVYTEVAKQAFKHSPIGQKVEDIKTFNKAMPYVDQYGGAASTRNIIADATDKKNQSFEDYWKDVKGGFTGKEKTSGEEIAKNLGVESKYGSKAAGFGIELLADPTNFVPVGIAGKVLKTGSKLSKLGKITEEGVKAADLEKTIADVAKTQKVSKSQAKEIVKNLSNLKKPAEEVSQAAPIQVTQPKQFKTLDDLKASSKVKQEAAQELIQPKTVTQKPIDYAAQKNELSTIHDADRQQFAAQNKDVIDAVSSERQRAVDQFNKEDMEWQGHEAAAKQYDDIMKSVGGRLNLGGYDHKYLKDLLSGKHMYSAAKNGQGDDVYKVADDLGFNNPEELIQTLNNGYASKQIVKAGKNKFYSVDGKKLQDPNPEAIIDEMHSQTPSSQQLKADIAKMDQLHNEQITSQPKEKLVAEHIEATPKELDPMTAPFHKLTNQEKKLNEAQPIPEGYDSVKHISEQINHNPKELGKVPLKQKLKDLGNKFYYLMVDDKHGAARTDKAAGKDINDSNSAVALAHKAAGSGEKARQVLEKGVFDENGQKIGKSFQEILQGAKDPDKLQEYLVAKGILDYDSKGMIAIKTDGISQRDIANSAINELEKAHPQIKEEAKDVYKFIDQQQQVLKEGGLLNQSQIDQMKIDNPNYIGFNRVMDEEGENFTTGKDGLRKRLANVGNPIKKRTGSEKQIISPLETLVKRQYVYTNMADRNKAGKAVLDNLRTLGDDNIFGSIVDKEENAIYKLMNKADEVANGSEDTLSTSINEMFSKKEGKNNLIYVYEDGHKYTIQVHDKLLFDSMMAMDQKAIPMWMKAVNAPVRMLRAGVTLSPDFGLRNFTRDQITTAITSKNNFIPIVDSIRGAVEIIKSGKGNSELVNAFTRNGGDMSALQNIDRQNIIKSYQDLRGKSVKQKLNEVIKDPIKLIDAAMAPLRKVGEFSEKSTRIGHMAKAVKKGKSLEQAAYEARSTMDFNRAGAWGRQLNQTVAFFNANIQGLDVTARALAKRPIPTLTKIGTYVVAPSVALYYLNHDKQWYKDIPDEDKDRNWFIKTGKDGEIIKIPKPFEVGILFGAGVERALRKGVDGEENTFNGYAKELFDTMTPDVLPTALKPLLEVATNYNLFTHNNIESMGDDYLPAEQRKTAYNSQIAGSISKGLSKLNKRNQISPKDIDHLIKGYTGTLGSYATEGIDMIAGALNKNIPDKPSRGVQTAPFIRSFVQKNLEGNNKPTNDFYQLHDDLQDMSKREDFKYGRQKKSIDRIYTKMNKLQKEKKDILNDNKINGKQKTKDIMILNKKITDMARKANEQNKIR